MEEFRELFKTREFLDEVSRIVFRVLKTRCPSLKHGDGEDIAQDVLIKILRATENGTKIENLRSYLWRAAYTTALDVLAEQGREAQIIEAAERPEMVKIIEAVSAEEVTERRNIRCRIERMVDDLPDARRRILKLYLLGLNTRDISAHLGWSHSKVRHLFYRSLEDLRKKSRRDAGPRPMMAVTYD